MDCSKVQEDLVHFHYGELDPGLVPRIEEHLLYCDECSRELDALECTLSFTRAAKAPPLPEAVRERLWARIEARRAGTLEALWGVFTPMVLGVGTCLLSLYPLHYFDMLSRTDPTILIVGSLIWASIYNSVFTSILHHWRLRRLLAPPARGDSVGEVSEPEEANGVRIQSVIYGLLISFTGLFWAALVLLGPGATRGYTGHTPETMTAISIGVLGLVGVGIGLLEKRHSLTTSTLVSSIYCALGIPALYMISHGQMSPRDTLVGASILMLTSLLGTALGQRLDAAIHPAEPERVRESVSSARTPGHR
jgi:hypothetical protein